MQISIIVSGEITYTHEREDTSVGGNITSSQDTHSIVLEGVKMCIDVESIDTPPTPADPDEDTDLLSVQTYFEPPANT